MTKLEVRAARDSDQQTILDVLLSTFETTWKSHLTQSGLAHAHDIRDRYQDYVERYWRYFFVATIDGQVVGMAHYYDNFVEALHVHSDAQGQGTGAALLSHICKLIVENYEEVRLETDSFNANTIVFYKAQGFIELDRYPDEEWHSDFTTVLMAKQVSLN